MTAVAHLETRWGEGVPGQETRADPGFPVGTGSNPRGRGEGANIQIYQVFPKTA